MNERTSLAAQYTRHRTATLDLCQLRSSVQERYANKIVTSVINGAMLFPLGGLEVKNSTSVKKTK